MDQLHKRFTSEQIKVLLQGYCQGTIERASVEETMGIGKTRFFALLKEYRQNPKAFFPSYKRATSARLSAAVKAEIERIAAGERAGRGPAAAHLQLQLLCAARPHGKERHQCLRDHDHPSGQEYGLLQAPSKEKSARQGSADSLHRSLSATRCLHSPLVSLRSGEMDFDHLH